MLCYHPRRHPRGVMRLRARAAILSASTVDGERRGPMKRTALLVGVGDLAYLLWLRPEWSAGEGSATPFMGPRAGSADRSAGDGASVVRDTDKRTPGRVVVGLV